MLKDLFKFFQCIEMNTRKPEETRLELMRRLNLINGFNLTKELVTRRPTRSLILLKVPGAMKTFQEAIDWALAQVQGSGYAEENTS
jgi:hypothetical protein